jgi:hypothetical protein
VGRRDAGRETGNRGLAATTITTGRVELVERKNIGHPNMICDAPLEATFHALGRMHCGLHQALGGGIPESDYPKLATLEGCGEHLAPLAASPPKKERLR